MAISDCNACVRVRDTRTSMVKPMTNSAMPIPSCRAVMRLSSSVWDCSKTCLPAQCRLDGTREHQHKRHADDPYSDALQHPEEKKLEKLVTCVIETSVFSLFHHTREQIQRKTEAPNDDEHQNYDCACRCVALRQREADGHQRDEVGTVAVIGGI